MEKTAKLFIYIEFFSDKLPWQDIKKIFNDGDLYCAEKGDDYHDPLKNGLKSPMKRTEAYCNILYEIVQHNESLCDILSDFLNKYNNNINLISNLCVDLKK